MERFSRGSALDNHPLKLAVLLSFLVVVASLCPDDLQFGEGECCTKCSPGYGMESKCSKENDTMCEACEEGVSFSDSWSQSDGCVKCSKCIKNAHVVTECNVTQDSMCECNDNFFYDTDSDLCNLCKPCAPGYGALRLCNSKENTICERCGNGTFSDLLSPTSSCLPCTVCGENQVTLQVCSSKQDTICLELSRPKPTLGVVASKPKQVVSTDDVNVIPLYCALMAAIVVGSLAYVIVKYFRKGKAAKRLKAKATHNDIEYAAADKADSGIFVETETKSYSLSSKVRDLPYSRRREVEQCLCIQKDKRATWKILARELGFTRAKVETLEEQAETELMEPAVFMFKEWCKSDSATVGLFLRALKKVGRTDVARVLNGDTSELRPLNDGTSH